MASGVIGRHGLDRGERNISVGWRCIGGDARRFKRIRDVGDARRESAPRAVMAYFCAGRHAARNAAAVMAERPAGAERGAALMASSVHRQALRMSLIEKLIENIGQRNEIGHESEMIGAHHAQRPAISRQTSKEVIGVYGGMKRRHAPA